MARSAGKLYAIARERKTGEGGNTPSSYYLMKLLNVMLASIAILLCMSLVMVLIAVVKLHL